MTAPDICTLLAGAAAGMVASAVQAAAGKAEDLLLLPPPEDADFAPRLVGRVADFVGVPAPEAARWAFGTGFHFGYGAFWGAGYAVVHERYPVHPVVGGLALGGLIYVITFPRWGGAVQTGTVRAPGERTRAMEFVLATVTTTFGLTVASTYPLLRSHLTSPDDVTDALV